VAQDGPLDQAISDSGDREDPITSRVLEDASQAQLTELEAIGADFLPNALDMVA
jgi:hypothetical protein